MEQNYIIANRTDTGATREVNEDSMVTFDSPNGRVIAVCDGMGGQAAGDVASRLACDIIRDILESNTFTTPTEAITRAVLAANQGILHRTASSPELTGMGSTCVIVIIKDGTVYYGWVGDSRIYYFSNGVLRQVSRDQSYVQQLVDAGQLSAAEAEHHPQKNEITNALGLETMTPPELCTAPLTPEPGSIMMLCSDGLSGMVSDAQMQQILGDSSLTLQEKTDALVNAANAAGGLDNITVQLVEFGTAAAAVGSTMAPARAAAQAVQKKSNRMMTLIGIILVILVIAGAIGWYVGKKDVKEDAKKERVEKGTSSDDREDHKPLKHQVSSPAPEPSQPAKTTTITPSKRNDKTNPKKDKKGTAADKLTGGKNATGKSTTDVINNTGNSGGVDQNGLRPKKGNSEGGGDGKEGEVYKP